MIGGHPRTPTGNSEFAAWARWVTESIGALRIVPVAGHRVSRTTRGQMIVPMASGGKGGGWQWANPPEYDSSRSYSPNTVVVVSPNNEAVLDGVNTPPVFAEAGIWICVQNTGDGSLTVNAPISPPYYMTDDSGNWLSTVYWVPLLLGPCPLQ